jgi:hypothetical protein
MNSARANAVTGHPLVLDNLLFGGAGIAREPGIPGLPLRGILE